MTVIGGVMRQAILNHVGREDGVIDRDSDNGVITIDGEVVYRSPHTDGRYIGFAEVLEWLARGEEA